MLNLRDYFAGQALAGILASEVDTDLETASVRAYHAADNMLRERSGEAEAERELRMARQRVQRSLRDEWHRRRDAKAIAMGYEQSMHGTWYFKKNIIGAAAVHEAVGPVDPDLAPYLDLEFEG